MLVIEPADPRAFATAKILRLEREDVPIVCASIYPPSPHSRRLGPVACLVKPFALSELEAALQAVVERVGLSA